MRKFCEALATITLILGIIGAILLASTYGVSYQEETIGTYINTVKMVEQREWGLTIGIFVGITFSTIVLSTILFGISEILKRLEKISDSEDDFKDDGK